MRIALLGSQFPGQFFFFPFAKFQSRAIPSTCTLRSRFPNLRPDSKDVLLPNHKQRTQLYARLIQHKITFLCPALLSTNNSEPEKMASESQNSQLHEQPGQVNRLIASPSLAWRLLAPSAITLFAAHKPNDVKFDKPTNSIGECYWPTIRAWIQAGNGLKPDVICHICLDTKLKIPGVEVLFPFTAEDTTEEIYVLSCGHAFGLQCLAELTAMHGRDIEWLRCLMCRAACFIGPPTLAEPMDRLNACMELVRLWVQSQCKPAKFTRRFKVGSSRIITSISTNTAGGMVKRCAKGGATTTPMTKSIEILLRVNRYSMWMAFSFGLDLGGAPNFLGIDCRMERFVGRDGGRG